MFSTSFQKHTRCSFVVKQKYNSDIYTKRRNNKNGVAADFKYAHY